MPTTTNPAPETTSAVDLGKPTDPAADGAVIDDDAIEAAIDAGSPARRDKDGTIDVEGMDEDLTQVEEHVQNLEAEHGKLAGRVGKLTGDVRKLQRQVSDLSREQARRPGRVWRWLAVVVVWLVTGGIVALMMLAVDGDNTKVIVEELWVPLLAALIATYFIASTD